MSNEPKHTATPWSQDGNDIKFWTDRGSMFIAECEEQVDAARIVQCVNEYDGLIETIESLRAVNAELIEALRLCKQYIGLLGHYLPMPVETTIAKYEKP